MNDTFSQSSKAFTNLFEQLKKINPTQLPQPPLWLQQAIQERLVLIVNHVLQQDGRAIDQLLPHQGKTVQAQWRSFNIGLRVTPAGLTALESNIDTADLSVQISETNPLQLINQTALGQRPKIQIHGEAELASTIHWLAENLRWNVQEDIAQIIGAQAAQNLVKIANIVRDVLGEFVNIATGNKASKKSTQLPYNHSDKPQ